MTPVTDATPWAEKAAALYDDAYAARYRSHDDTLATSGPYLAFVAWLQSVCDRFTPPIDALELGCGTGRYFSSVRGVRTLVGIDASPAMLELARQPFQANLITAERVSLVQGDLLTHDFGEAAFDLVYSIGVLAEHVPLDKALVSRVTRWLRPGGRFAFSTVHPDSPSVPRTMGRVLGRLVAPWAPDPLKRALRERLMSGGLYADETRVKELLAPGFAIESLERFVSEAHLHCLCVARKVSA